MLKNNLGSFTELASLDSGNTWSWFTNIELSEYRYVAACAVINGGINNIKIIPVNLFRLNTPQSALSVEIYLYESQKLEQTFFAMSGNVIGLYNNRTPESGAVAKLYGIK